MNERALTTGIRRNLIKTIVGFDGTIEFDAERPTVPQEGCWTRHALRILVGVLE